MRELPKRKRLAEGVFVFSGQPTIVLATVCSYQRQPHYANDRFHEALVEAWREADSWLVGRYIVMPNHIHLFCSPVDESHSIEHWTTFWKRQVHRLLGGTTRLFQSHAFHHRLRHDESYGEKWNYVCANPVRAGLVASVDDWKFQGELNVLRW